MYIKRIVKTSVIAGYFALGVYFILAFMRIDEISANSVFLNMLMVINVVAFICFPYIFLRMTSKVRDDGKYKSGNKRFHIFKGCMFCLSLVGAYVALFFALLTEQNATGTITPFFFMTGSYSLIESCVNDVEVVEQKLASVPSFKVLLVASFIGLFLATILLVASLH